MTVTHHVGDALTLMRAMPDASVDAVICSPPFLALRDYNGTPGQWGSEPDPASFLANLLALTNETRRVLTPHGSIAWELGDTYAGSGGAGGDYGANGMRAGQPKFRAGTPRWDGRPAGQVRTTTSDPVSYPARGRTGWPLPKSMTLTPTLFPACLAYGRNLLDPDAEPFDPWRVRNLIVWCRSNPAVGALGDKVRPATSYITVACTSGRRWFDLDSIRGGASAARAAGGAVLGVADSNNGAPPLDHWWDEPDGDLTWLINTQGSSLAHYAMWPPKLAERLVLSMVPREVCRVCGEPRRRLVKAERRMVGKVNPGWKLARSAATGGGAMAQGATTSRETLGWSDCGHGSYRPGIVCDPFAGTGTTLAVADIHGRDAIGFDLDPANRELYPTRHRQVWKALGRKAPAPVTPAGRQISLFG